MANSVLEICWLRNRQSTSDLLIRETRYWSGITILSMAHKAKMEEFMSQPACYAKLNKIWRGDISLSTHYIRVGRFFTITPKKILTHGAQSSWDGLLLHRTLTMQKLKFAIRACGEVGSYSLSLAQPWRDNFRVHSRSFLVQLHGFPTRKSTSTCLWASLYLHSQPAI